MGDRSRTMGWRIIPILAIFLAGAAFSAVDEQNKGAAEILLQGGTTGAVFFPHHRHQETLKDCGICHELYPKEPGVIHSYIDQGKLEKKQVMNKQCTRCHREKKNEGVKAGPITCKSCHHK